MAVQDLTRTVLRCRRGTAAIEFAFVAPVFLVLVFGIVVFGSYIAMANGLQQLAAEAARAAIAGLNDDERAALARASVAAHAAAYAFLEPARVSIVSASTSSGRFSITLRYDASASPLLRLPFATALPTTIVRSASMQRGGY